MKQELKDKLKEELKFFIVLTLFLTLFMNALMVYRHLVTQQPIWDYFRLGYNFLEAAILSKVILLGRHFRIGERFHNQPLVIPTIYKSLAFSLFIVVFAVLEHFAKGFFRGESFWPIYYSFSLEMLSEILGLIPIYFCFFLLFFGYAEIERRENLNIFNLFFKNP